MYNQIQQQQVPSGGGLTVTIMLCPFLSLSKLA